MTNLLKKQKFLLHIDMNAFFASVEEVENKGYANKPLVVGSDTKRSVVSACNYLARSYGISAAMPMYRAKLMCPSAVIVPCRISLYEDYSKRFIRIIRNKLSNKIEYSSIDECYVDISSLCKNSNDATKIAKRIQLTILSDLGIKTSIGVSYNKFLAKMGSDYKKPMGITAIFTQKDLEKIIWPQPIDNMYFIGKVSANILKSNEINTIGDMAKEENLHLIKKSLNKNWEAHHFHALGQGNSTLDFSYTRSKSVSVARTFIDPTNSLEEIIFKLKELTKELVARLSYENLEGKTVSVYVKNPNFITRSKSLTVGSYVFDYSNIFRHMKDVYLDNFEDQEIRLIGIRISNLKEKVAVFNSPLFDDYVKEPVKKINEFEKIVKDINSKMELDILYLASSKFIK